MHHSYTPTRLKAIGGIAGFRGTQASRSIFNDAMSDMGFGIKIGRPKTMDTLKIAMREVIYILPKGTSSSYQYKVDDLSDPVMNGFIVSRVSRDSVSLDRTELVRLKPKNLNCAHNDSTDYEIVFLEGMPGGPIGSEENMRRDRFYQQFVDRYANLATKEVVPGGVIGAHLRKVFDDVFNAYGLGGQNYWLDPEASEKWEVLLSKLHPISTRYFKLDATSEATLRSVRDMISADIEKRANKIDEDIATGNLSDQALETRKSRAKELLDEIRKIEKHFGGTLDFIRTKVNLASQGLASSQSMIDDNDIFKVDL